MLIDQFDEANANEAFEGSAAEPALAAVKMPDSDELLKFIENNRSKATRQKTNQVFRKFFDFLIKRGNSLENEKDIKSLTAEKLDTELGAWLMDLRKHDGNQYEPGTIVSYYGAVKRKLEELGYTLDLGKDPRFWLSRKVLSAKKTELKKAGLGNLPKKADALVAEDEDKLWEGGYLV